MLILYNTGIFFYSLLIRITSLLNEKARFFVRGRKNWKKKLKAKIEPNARYIWFHCASLGEFEQGRPLIEAIKKQFPEYKIALTFFSPSGYEIRKNYALADIVSYLPLDTKQNAKSFIQILKPEKVFFIKYEFWFHYITELKKREIPLYVISAIFRENQQFFKNSVWGNWYKKMLLKVDYFFVQNQTSAHLLQNLGINNVLISGDTRFDRVAEIAKNCRNIPIVEKFKGNSTLFIAGSTWKPDEELLVELINKNREIKFIIAPHEVSATNINRLQQLLKNSVVLFSQANESEINKFQVLIIDSIGLLSSLYQYGNIGYIGGGFGVGIHNILEAATFGLPIIFGPNHKKFQEANELIENGGAFPISNAKELKTAFNNLITDNKHLKNSSGICKNYIAKNVGSSQLIIKKVFNI